MVVDRPPPIGPPGADGLGSPVSLRDLLQRPALKRLVGDDRLQPPILALKLLEALDVVGLHPTLLIAPAVIGVLRDAERPRDLRDRLLLGQHPVGLTQLADDLLRRMPRALHRDRPRSPILQGA